MTYEVGPTGESPPLVLFDEKIQAMMSGAKKKKVDKTSKKENAGYFIADMLICT